VRIGFDLDGVLADLHGPFVQAAVRLFPDLDPSTIAEKDIGGSPPDADADDDAADADGPDEQATVAGDVPLTRRQISQVWDHIESVEDFWETLGEIESGAIARLAKVADERRWEVIFITSRPHSAGRTVQRQSQRWLQRHGFDMPSLFVVHGSRGAVAQALNLDIIVDDRPDNCLDIVLESKAGAILVWRGTKANVPVSARRLGIAVVSTVAAALDALIEADKPSPETSFLDRLRRLFGLRTASSASTR
jgi:uncharacterized protein